MASNKILWIVIAMVIITSELVSASQRRLCGRALTAALTTICESNYNEMNTKTEIYNSRYFGEQPAVVSKSLSFLSKLSEVTTQRIRIRTKRGGVSDECCKKPCSYKELTSYCKIPPHTQPRGY